MRPKRTDDKYWTGTRNFNHIQYENDLEDYIIDLENKAEQLRLGAVGQSFYCDERDKWGNTECGQQCMVCCRDEIALQ